MNRDQLSALVSAADESDSITFDGLTVERRSDGYRFETPDATHGGLRGEELRQVCESNPWFVSNWHYWNAIDRSDAERAFLRWIERAPSLEGPTPSNDVASRGVRERYEALAEGMHRDWGQVLISAELGTNGRRIYHARHEDDANESLTGLEVHADPLTARHIVKYDDGGRYRPLKTAPTMPTGWAFTDLDGTDLVRLVDVIYPATVANWYRERRGQLDVSHYRDTAARQTGIYDLITDLPGPAVEWLAEACCVDSQCLKRRRWDEDAETSLDVPRGNGEFPCREPCSLVVAAARKWTQLEGEQPQTYEFDLTPGEKEQIEAIIDAVAAGRIDDIREADFGDGANRYRVRYLRAKLMDDQGHLCGMPTDAEDDV